MYRSMAQWWSWERVKGCCSLSHDIQTLQQKFLKRTVGVASSTANSFIFLELGVLPMKYEIERRQMMYLYRIIHLESNDPVWLMFCEQQRMHEAGERNWWSGVKCSLEKYCLPVDIKIIKEMSKDGFSAKVKESVVKTAVHELVSECQGLKKTAKLQYETLELQDYFRQLYPAQAKTVFKWRSETLDIKSHLTYKYKDLMCRGNL